MFHLLTLKGVCVSDCATSTRDRNWPHQLLQFMVISVVKCENIVSIHNNNKYTSYMNICACEAVFGSA